MNRVCGVNCSLTNTHHQAAHGHFAHLQAIGLVNIFVHFTSLFSCPGNFIGASSQSVLNIHAGKQNISNLNSSNNICDVGSSIRCSNMVECTIKFSSFSRNSGIHPFQIFEGSAFFTQNNLINNNSTLSNGLFYIYSAAALLILKINSCFMVNNLFVLFQCLGTSSMQIENCFINHNLTLLTTGVSIFINGENCLDFSCFQNTHLIYHLSTGVCLAQLTPPPSNDEIYQLDVTPCITLPNPPTPPISLPPSPTSCEIYSNNSNYFLSYMTILQSFLNSILIFE